MKRIINFILYETYRHPDPINCGSEHKGRVNEVREKLGQRYLCHPANRVKAIWRGPCQPESTRA